MKIEQTGIVIEPDGYKKWEAEITGDTTDTGGFYAIIYNPTSPSEQLLFLEVSYELLLKSIYAKNITIQWVN